MKTLRYASLAFENILLRNAYRVGRRYDNENEFNVTELMIFSLKPFSSLSSIIHNCTKFIMQLRLL